MIPRAASRAWTLGRHWSPPYTLTSPSVTALAAMMFTTRSNRMRGDAPYTVAKRMITGTVAEPPAP